MLCLLFKGLGWNGSCPTQLHAMGTVCWTHADAGMADGDARGCWDGGWVRVHDLAQAQNRSLAADSGPHNRLSPVPNSDAFSPSDSKHCQIRAESTCCRIKHFNPKSQLCDHRIRTTSLGDLPAPGSDGGETLSLPLFSPPPGPAPSLKCVALSR